MGWVRESPVSYLFIHHDTGSIFRVPSFSREVKNPSAYVFIVLNEICFQDTAYKLKNFNRH